MSSLDIPIDGVTIDVARAPHILMAGMTGSGKSMGLAHMLAELVTRYSWKELRLWLIDPKRVELSQFRDVPHLLDWPAVTPDEAMAILVKATDEMHERYEVLEQAGVRDIDAYNEAQGFQRWPRILIVIDELANLMLAPRPTGAFIERYIADLTAMSRAVGIHLILATQRPTTDVVTGLIKANVPTRIAFGTVSAVDSRVILDETGAEDITEPGQALMRVPRTRGLTGVRFPYVADDTIDAAVRQTREVHA